MKMYDIAVIGSGISGLFFCLRASKQNPEIKIALITKSTLDNTNTVYAQGGFCCVSDFEKDSFEKHIQDTQIAGDGLCDKAVVEFVVKESPSRVQDLTDLGVEWDMHEGRLSLSREGGHSEKRIIHHKDFTGRHIQMALIKALKSHPAIDIFEHTWATELLTTPDSKICYGVEVLTSDEQLSHIIAGQTILASGGAGQAYKRTTNSSIATGDGIVMAHRAGAKVLDMQFIQFHPTSFYPMVNGQVFLITEALRGEGAVFRNREGQAFMDDYDPRGSLAPRDVISQALHNEFTKANIDHVFLDCTHIDSEVLKKKFPHIYKVCSEAGYPPDEKWLPITPAAHYTCGGIEVNHYGETSIPNLYAIGECSHTGLHGANRLASNSLLEGVIFAERAVTRCLQQSIEVVQAEFPEPSSNTRAFVDLELLNDLRSQIQWLMSKHVGIVRNHKGLKLALDSLDKIKDKVNELLKEYKKNTALVELDFLVSVSRLIVAHSIDYPQNKGGFYNTDLV